MTKERKGEVVRIIAEQDDAEGNVQSRVTAEWFGFDNNTANSMSMALVETNLAAIEGIRVMREQGASTADAVNSLRGKGRK